jgi:hypothetical protein
MGTREFEIDPGAVLKIEALEGDSVQVRSGEVWVTQHGDSKDYLLKAGDSMALSGEGVALAMACKPTLLDLHREDPRSVREQIVRDAKHAQAQAMRALFRKIFT